MDEAQWTAVTIIGPIILGLILVWAVLKSRSRAPKRLDDQAENATDRLYDEEERRRREGTDGL